MTSTTSPSQPKRPRKLSVNQTVQGFAEDVLPTISSNQFDLCVTSPPYYKLRNYTEDCADELGKEDTPEGYLGKLVRIFTEVHRVLKLTGSLWVNIDDTYSNGSPLLIPERLCIAMEATGLWKLKNKVVWYKPSCPVETMQSRFSRKYEMFYWFARAGRTKPYFDLATTKIPARITSVERLQYPTNTDTAKMATSRMQWVEKDARHKVERILAEGVNPGDVWITPPNMDRDIEHPAPFPALLITRAIVACCPEGGIVLDPFMGSGTTGVAARQLMRHFLGIELNSAFAQQANERTARTSEGELFENETPTIDLIGDIF